MKWKTLKSQELFSSGLFRLNSESCQLPDGRVMPRYYVMEFPDWVNILPITKEGEVILVRQYRQASQQVHLEIPGGSMDPGTTESILEGARREMLEETGYDSARIEKVFSHYPNPALQRNQMHTFVAYDCVKVQDQRLDEFESLELYFCSIEKLQEHLHNGDIDHSLMVASVCKILSVLKKS